MTQRLGSVDSHHRGRDWRGIRHNASYIDYPTRFEGSWSLSRSRGFHYSKSRNRCQSEHSMIFRLVLYFLRASTIMASRGLEPCISPLPLLLSGAHEI
jgi:hypothetical protein